MHRGVPHLPVNLEWFVGLDGTLVNNPAVGGGMEFIDISDRIY